MQGEFRDVGDESIATVLVISTAGCADTTRDPHVDYSGFLGDYSNLMEGDATQAERRNLGTRHAEPPRSRRRLPSCAPRGSVLSPAE